MTGHGTPVDPKAFNASTTEQPHKQNPWEKPQPPYHFISFPAKQKREGGEISVRQRVFCRWVGWRTENPVILSRENWDRHGQLSSRVVETGEPKENTNKSQTQNIQIYKL